MKVDWITSDTHTFEAASFLAQRLPTTVIRGRCDEQDKQTAVQISAGRSGSPPAAASNKSGQPVQNPHANCGLIAKLRVSEGADRFHLIFGGLLRIGLCWQQLDMLMAFVGRQRTVHKTLYYPERRISLSLFPFLHASPPNCGNCRDGPRSSVLKSRFRGKEGCR